MVKDISEFKLTKETAKEYFFLNDCKMSSIDRNGLSNSTKFRNYCFSNSTLSEWTNEWMKPKTVEGIINKDYELLYSFIEDYSDRIDVDNSLLLIELYNSVKQDFKCLERKELDVLYHYEEPVFLDRKFEYGLIYLAHKNKLINEQNSLFERFLEVNSLINFYDDSFISKMKRELLNNFKKKG